MGKLQNNHAQRPSLILRPNCCAVKYLDIGIQVQRDKDTPPIMAAWSANRENLEADERRRVPIVAKWEVRQTWNPKSERGSFTALRFAQDDIALRVG